MADHTAPVLCRLGLHRWKKEPDQLGCYGMGLEWFECWRCRRCPATADCLRGSRGKGNSYQENKHGR